jgi:hypothetical protein
MGKGEACIPVTDLSDSYLDVQVGAGGGRGLHSCD